MTKKEQIKEMSGNIKEALNSHCRLISANSCNDCEFLKYRKPGTDCQSMCISENLYNAGYRKADEVRNETAKEILKILYDQGIDKNIIECCSIYDINGILIAKEICGKYGVKVEE